MAKRTKTACSDGKNQKSRGGSNQMPPSLPTASISSNAVDPMHMADAAMMPPSSALLASSQPLPQQSLATSTSNSSFASNSSSPISSLTSASTAPSSASASPVMSPAEFLRVKIDLPSIQFELSTGNPTTALPELRKILERLQLDDDVVYEEFVLQELRTQLSDAFLGDKTVVEIIKRLLKEEEDYRVGRADIPFTTTIDFDNGTKDTHLNTQGVKRAMAKMLRDVETSAVKNGVVHLQGNISNDDKALIVDHIHTLMPTAQLRAFSGLSSAKKDSAQESARDSSARDSSITFARIECILFGDFPNEDDD